MVFARERGWSKAQSDNTRKSLGAWGAPIASSGGGRLFRQNPGPAGGRMREQLRYTDVR